MFTIKNIGMILFSLMFLWSGINKIKNFDKKINTLFKKTNWNLDFCKIAMILVILLEVVGILLLIDYNSFNFANLNKKIIKLILLALLAFIVIVTPIYHPPDVNKLIPFLSNVSLFGLLLYVYADY